MVAPTPRRTESHFTGADGLLLMRRAWLPERVERVMVLVHGFAEHSGRYEDMACWFLERGVAVHAYDQRGHGRSGGTRCHVGRFSEFLDDLACLLEIVGEEHPGVPVTLVGHSMGGLITAAFLADRQPALSSAVTSGATLALGDDVSALRIAASKLLSRLLPRLPVGSPVDPNGLSRDPAVVRDYIQDPLVYRSMTASLATALVDAVSRTAVRAPEVQVPLLMLHGEADPLCRPSGSRSFFQALESPESDLVVYPELRHEIFNEPEREQVYQDIWDWLERISK